MDMKRIGSKGGKARLTKMTPEERSRIAREAAAKRWGKKGDEAVFGAPVPIDGWIMGMSVAQREALDRIKTRFAIGSDAELLDRIIAKWDPALKPSEGEPVKTVVRCLASVPARSVSGAGFDPLTGEALPERRPMQKGGKK